MFPCVIFSGKRTLAHVLGKVQCERQVFEEHTCARHLPWMNSTASCWLTRPFGK